MADIKLKIRHAKRGNEKSLDLSGFGMTELPADILQLTMLEVLNISNNKLNSLRKVESLPNLRVIDASNNNITQLHQELLDMFSLDTIYLFGNPIVNSNPVLAKIEGNSNQLRKSLESYFGVSSSTGSGAIGGVTSGLGSLGLGGSGSSSLGLGGSSQISNSVLGGGVSQMGSVGGAIGTSYKSQATGNYGSMGASGLGGGVGSFLQNDMNMNDPAQLRKRIAELEQENKGLKEGGSSLSGNKAFGTMGRPGAMGQDKDWMNFGSQPIERPTTANTANQQVRVIQEELKIEQREKKRLLGEIENYKRELQKSNFSAFTSTAAQVSVSSGRLPSVAGVREINLDDIEIAEQISQGGFSVIHKGTLNGTQVAIKKIFDPRLTDELLSEIYNEIVMQSILRHPNIALLMGVMPKMPNIVIVFEYMPGSLYSLLHIKKQAVQMTMEDRLKIARDVAVTFYYMHELGIVHRDLKSHNILVDEHFNIKICDFGLARFKADLGKGTMQFSGTPAYMAPELFQKRLYDETVDVFAFGALLWELVAREVPYDGLDVQDIRSKVERDEPLKIPYGTDQRIGQLIHECRMANSSERPSFGRILEVLNYFVKQQ